MPHLSIARCEVLFRTCQILWRRCSCTSAEGCLFLRAEAKRPNSTRASSAALSDSSRRMLRASSQWDRANDSRMVLAASACKRGKTRRSARDRALSAVSRNRLLLAKKPAGMLARMALFSEICSASCKVEKRVDIHSDCEAAKLKAHISARLYIDRKITVSNVSVRCTENVPLPCDSSPAPPAATSALHASSV